MMRIIDKKIRAYQDALDACARRRARGFMVTDDVKFLTMRLKQFKQERSSYDK